MERYMWIILFLNQVPQAFLDLILEALHVIGMVVNHLVPEQNICFRKIAV
jgi:hypothetical protein